MLVDEETEDGIDAAILALIAGFGIFLIGRDLRLRSQARYLNQQTQRLSLLDQTYLAGRIASEIGVQKMKSMSTQQLTEWLQENDVQMTPADRAQLTKLHRDTERWLKGRSDAWQNKIRQVLSRGDRDFSALLTLSRLEDAAQMTAMRTASIEEMIAIMEDVIGEMAGEANRLLQTETATYFQHGQTTNRKKSEIVYKVPRAGACMHCRRLHLNSDGTYKKYRLGDIIGNSNIGLPASAWQFTVGPVHPYCYCVLHYESDGKEPAPFSPLRKSAEPNDCGVPNDPNLLFDAQVEIEHSHSHDHDHGEHEQLLEALRSAAFAR